MNIILPTAPTPPERINPKFCLFYGPRKVGKTSNLARLPKSLILDLEVGGTDYITATKIKIGWPEEADKNLESLNHFLDVCKEIKKHKPRLYDYVIVDTIDQLELWALDLATKRYKEAPVGKNFKGNSVEWLPEGAGYKWIREAFREILQETYALADTVIYVGHVRDKDITNSTNTATSKELDLIGKNKAIMCQMCDTVGHFYRNPMNGNIGVNFVSHEHILCSSRVSHVTGKKFEFKGSNVDWSQIFLPE